MNANLDPLVEDCLAALSLSRRDSVFAPMKALAHQPAHPLLRGARLVQLIETELAKHDLNGQEVARDARLPADAFRSLRRGYRPTLDRADELCRALGITMTIGARSAANENAAGEPPTTRAQERDREPASQSSESNRPNTGR